VSLLDVFRPTPRDDLAAQRQRRAIGLARECLLELDRDDLNFGPFGTVTHRGGRTYKVARGVIEEPRDSSAAAFYLAASGHVVYLEQVRA
jgi:hypothetical protein